MKKKKMHAVEWVRSMRDRQYEESEGKSPEELLAFFHREAAAMNDWVPAVT
jgi:hypothetical protein